MFKQEFTLFNSKFKSDPKIVLMKKMQFPLEKLFSHIWIQQYACISKLSQSQKTMVKIFYKYFFIVLYCKLDLEEIEKVAHFIPDSPLF